MGTYVYMHMPLVHYVQAVNALPRLHRCAGWFEPIQDTHEIVLISHKMAHCFHVLYVHIKKVTKNLVHVFSVHIKQ